MIRQAWEMGAERIRLIYGRAAIEEYRPALL